MSQPPTRQFRIQVVRNVVEYAAIFGWWGIALLLINVGQFGVGLLTILVLVGCWTKTGLFGAENLKQLYEAAQCNLAHHRFLVLMGINMSQMILSFSNCSTFVENRG